MTKSNETLLNWLNMLIGPFAIFINICNIVNKNEIGLSIFFLCMIIPGFLWSFYDLIYGEDE